MLSSSPVYIDIVPRAPLPEVSSGIGPHVNPIPAYVPLPKFAHHRGQHTRRSKGKPRGGRITTLLPADYVLSKQIDNNNDAHQSEGGIDDVLAGPTLLEGVEGSAPLEGVLDRQQEGSVLLEGDLEVGSSLLEGDEVVEFSALLEGDDLDEDLPLEDATEEVEAFIPLENVMLRRKAAKRTLPWDLKAEELDLVSLLQQAEDIRAMREPQLETPIAIATITAVSEAAAQIASPDVAIALSPPADVDDDANADSVTDTQSKPRAAGVTGRWTREEYAELTSAITNAKKNKWSIKREWVEIFPKPKRKEDSLSMNIDAIVDPISSLLGKKRARDWVEISPKPKRKEVSSSVTIDAIVDPISSLLGKKRTSTRIATATTEAVTKRALPDIVMTPPPDDDDANTDSATTTKSKTRAAGIAARWTPKEDTELTSAVANTCKTKRGEEYITDWVAVAALVPGRTRDQCGSRWRDVLYPSIYQANGRTGKWTEDEDIKLKDAVQTHGGKHWVEIAALVSSRTRRQCYNRWNIVLDPSIGRANGRTGKWTEDENIKLKDAVQMHGGKDWGAIAALVLGRTKKQCCARWKDTL